MIVEVGGIVLYWLFRLRALNQCIELQLADDYDAEHEPWPWSDE